MTEQDNFTQLCVWPSTIVGGKVDEFVAFMKENFGARVRFDQEVKTLPDMEDGQPVPETGGRIDVFFYVHKEDLAKFALSRLTAGIRWWEDVLGNGGGVLYSQEILDKYPKYPKKR